MFHTVAWFQSVDPGNAFQAINGVPDPSITVNGISVRVLPTMPNIIGTAALINDASAVRAQLQSPSLRASVNQDIEPIVAAAVFGTDPPLYMHPQSPRALAEDEDMNFFVQSDPAAAAAHYGLAWLADGPQQAVDGEIITVRATSACALSAGVWVNGALTFSQVLPVGRYSVVGMRARGANLVAARLVFVGAAHRPGVPAVNAVGNRDSWYFRTGRLGVWGDFHTNTPPTVDCLGITDTAQVLEFDLIRQ
jgi:hypothetical protein